MEQDPYEKIRETEFEQQKYSKPKLRIVKNIIHNFSSYKLTPEEEQASSVSLNDHIPVKQNDIKIKTELLLQRLKYTNHLDQQKQDQLKSKIQRIWENHSQINVPYKFRKITDNISRNKDVILIKQDEGR